MILKGTLLLLLLG